MAHFLLEKGLFFKGTSDITVTSELKIRGLRRYCLHCFFLLCSPTPNKSYD